MKALILCAGRGTRLGGLVRDIPKPMLDLEGLPIVEHIVRRLVAQGMGEIAINLHYLGEAIRTHLGTGERLGAQIEYFPEVELLGGAGTVRALLPWWGQGELLVHYGDILTDQDFGALRHTHRARQALGTILVHRRRSNSAVYPDAEGRVLRFLERPAEPPPDLPDGPPWVFSGVCVLSPAALDLLPSSSPADLPRDLFPPLVELGRLYVEPLGGYRCAIDSEARLEEARSALREGRVTRTPKAPVGGRQTASPLTGRQGSG